MKVKNLYKRILKKLFGKCYVDGHVWKKKIGWQNNPEWKLPTDMRLNAFHGMTKRWDYYECKRCKAVGE